MLTKKNNSDNLLKIAVKIEFANASNNLNTTMFLRYYLLLKNKILRISLNNMNLLIKIKETDFTNENFDFNLTCKYYNTIKKRKNIV